MSNPLASAEARVLSHKQFHAACLRADVLMKKTQGHSFIHCLKTRCQYCNASPKRKGKCGQWLLTLLHHLEQEINNELKENL